MNNWSECRLRGVCVCTNRRPASPQEGGWPPEMTQTRSRIPHRLRETPDSPHHTPKITASTPRRWVPQLSCPCLHCAGAPWQARAKKKGGVNSRGTAASAGRLHAAQPVPTLIRSDCIRSAYFSMVVRNTTKRGERNHHDGSSRVGRTSTKFQMPYFMDSRKRHPADRALQNYGAYLSFTSLCKFGATLIAPNRSAFGSRSV